MECIAMEKNIKTNKKKSFTKEDFGVEVWLKVSDLIIDEDTQRGSMSAQIQKLVDDFNPNSFGRIMVSKRKDGYYVTDGQHRKLCALKMGIKEVPCILIDNICEDENDAKKNDAKQFLNINQNSQTVRAIDKYRIGVSAQLPDWLHVKDVIETNGLRAGTTINSVNAIASIYKYINSSKNIGTIKSKKNQMSKAINILNDSIGVQNINHLSLQATCILVREYIDTKITTVDDFIVKFNKSDMHKLIANAQMLKNNDAKKNVITFLAFLMAQEYNNNTKKDIDKLPLARLNI